MEPSRILGGVALAVGGSLLLSEPLLGQKLVAELTGTPPPILKVSCGMVSLLGVLALGLSVGDGGKSKHDEQGAPQ